MELGEGNVPNKIKMLLWGKAAGWCQYPGCTARLMIDSTTKAEFNQAYVAHIVADSPDGPRGDSINSPLLRHDINNLMLLCDAHHRLIDKEDVDSHPVTVLQQMKQEQEKRIARQTAIRPELSTEIVLYRSNIGPQPSFVNFQKAGNALLKEGRYPAATEADTITLGFFNSYAEDHEFGFWHIEQDNLRKQVETSLGYEVLVSRTEIGGYCPNCQVLRRREMEEAAAQPMEELPPQSSDRNT